MIRETTTADCWGTLMRWIVALAASTVALPGLGGARPVPASRDASLLRMFSRELAVLIVAAAHSLGHRPRSATAPRSDRASAPGRSRASVSPRSPHPPPPPPEAAATAAGPRAPSHPPENQGERLFRSPRRFASSLVASRCFGSSSQLRRSVVSFRQLVEASAVRRSFDGALSASAGRRSFGSALSASAGHRSFGRPSKLRRSIVSFGSPSQLRQPVVSFVRPPKLRQSVVSFGRALLASAALPKLRRLASRLAFAAAEGPSAAAGGVRAPLGAQQIADGDRRGGPRRDLPQIRRLESAKRLFRDPQLADFACLHRSSPPGMDGWTTGRPRESTGRPRTPRMIGEGGWECKPGSRIRRTDKEGLFSLRTPCELSRNFLAGIDRAVKSASVAAVLAFFYEGPGLHRDLHGQLSHREAEPRCRRSGSLADLARLVGASPARFRLGRLAVGCE